MGGVECAEGSEEKNFNITGKTVRQTGSLEN